MWQHIHNKSSMHPILTMFLAFLTDNFPGVCVHEGACAAKFETVRGSVVYEVVVMRKKQYSVGLFKIWNSAWATTPEDSVGSQITLFSDYFWLSLGQEISPRPKIRQKRESWTHWCFTEEKITRNNNGRRLRRNSENEFRRKKRRSYPLLYSIQYKILACAGINLHAVSRQILLEQVF